MVRVSSQGSGGSGSGGPVRWDSDSFPAVDYPPAQEQPSRPTGRAGGEAARDLPGPGQAGEQDGGAPGGNRGGWAGSRPGPLRDQGGDPQQRRRQREGWGAQTP